MQFGDEADEAAELPRHIGWPATGGRNFSSGVHMKASTEIDTVGNCSVVDSKPSATSGMKIMGDKGGYASKEDAAKALKGLPKGKCKGIVG